MSDFFDELEVRDPAARESELMAALPGQLAHAKAHAPFTLVIWLKSMSPW